MLARVPDRVDTRVENTDTVTMGPAMIRFPHAARAWGSDAFRQTLRQEIERLDDASLPLQQGLARSSAVADGGFEVMILGVGERHGEITARAGLFYRGVIGGCSCADDPTPMDTVDEYCEVDIRLDTATAVAQISLRAY